MMKSSELVNKAKEIATKFKTLYVMGCFGAPMTASNKTRYCNNHSYNKDPDRQAMIKSASADTFGFDSSTGFSSSSSSLIFFGVKFL